MQTKLIILFFLISCAYTLEASVPVNDTIVLNTSHVEGRWIHKNEVTEKTDIYIFRDDFSFHKASDSGELLFFDVAGKYKLSNDSITILYQDFGRGTNARAKVRKKLMQVIALSDEELNIYETENKQTRFIRLKRQNIK